MGRWDDCFVKAAKLLNGRAYTSIMLAYIRDVTSSFIILLITPPKVFYHTEPSHRSLFSLTLASFHNAYLRLRSILCGNLQRSTHPC